MHVTTGQVTAVWNRYESELATFDTELVVRHIVNKNDENHARPPVYKEDLEGLRVGHWVENTIVKCFARKTFKRLDRSGAPDIYKRFRIMDGSFMFYIYRKYEKYNYNVCHHMVAK
jgi:hypothetical protein